MADKPQYGGQAVIEGVMMRGPRYYAVACRRANNEITVREEPVEATILGRFKWLNKPFLRGTLALIDAMALGMKALMFSADLAMKDIEAAEADKPKKAGKGRKAQAATATDGGSERINDIAIWGTMVLALAMAVGIFFVLPQLLAGLLEKPLNNNKHMLNFVVGILKFVIFIGYILAISRMKDIRRVFEYHGAEHRVINTYEAGKELTPENIAAYGTIHQRCGTSFILVVLVISVVLGMFLGWQEWYVRVLIRLSFLPIIAGLAYETIRFAGRHRDSKIVNAILAPGLLLQRVTTQPPSDDQIEVARAALEAVLAKEHEADTADSPSDLAQALR